MPRNSFRPFSLASAFSADVSDNNVSDNNVSGNTATNASTTTTSATTTTSTNAMEPKNTELDTPQNLTVISITESEPAHCGCSRCMGRTRSSRTISNEAIDKKLNWILTLVIFMFIFLVVHIRSQRVR